MLSLGTRQNLFSKGIIVDPGGISCVFCNEICARDFRVSIH